MKIIYGWRNGIFAADPNKIGKEIKGIEIINPEAIVKKAEDNTTELHKCFEWDNSKAAHNYRKHQARKIISDLEIVEIRTPKKEPKILNISAYESIKNDDKKREYVNILEGIKYEPDREKIMDGIKTLLAQATYKLEKYNEVINMILDK